MCRANRLLLACMCVIPVLSYAELGGDAGSIINDNKVLSSAVSQVKTTISNDASYQISTITTDKCIINEYLANDMVFAVSWHQCSRYPDFNRLLGNYAPQLKTAAKDSNPNTTSSQLSGNDFKFQMRGLPGMLSGSAYIPSKVPASVNIRDLK